jgi:hypothetical protein
LFGTYEKHNLRQAAFGRETNFWTIYEDFREPILGVTVSKDGTFLDQRSNTFLLYPTYQGTVIPYTYYADINHLQMNTAHGSVEFCMDDTDQLRIRGNGVGLKMILRAEKPFGSCCGCRGVYPTPEGAWEADMGIHGKMLFVPLKGALVLTDPWNVEKMSTISWRLSLFPRQRRTPLRLQFMNTWITGGGKRATRLLTM